MSDVALKVRDLSVTFGGRAGWPVRAVRGVSFDLRHGEILALVGESGSGKSTIALTVAQLNRDQPGIAVSGSVAVDGVEVLALSERELQRVRGQRIGSVFQDPGSSLDPMQRVGQHVVEAIRAHDRRASRQEAIKRAQESLKLVGFPSGEDRFYSFPHQLSGGLQQRVMIAGALALHPTVLIADEPTTSLDTTVQAQVLVELRRLSVEKDIGVLLITHDLAIVSEIGDRVAVMYAGRIVESGSVATVLESPAHPYTRGLIASAPRLTGPRMPVFPTIVGQPHRGEGVRGCAFVGRCPESLLKCAENPPPLIDVGGEHSAECWLLAETEES